MAKWHRLPALPACENAHTPARSLCHYPKMKLKLSTTSIASLWLDLEQRSGANIQRCQENCSMQSAMRSCAIDEDLLKQSSRLKRALQKQASSWLGSHERIPILERFFATRLAYLNFQLVRSIVQSQIHPVLQRRMRKAVHANVSNDRRGI
jgi:hypothetical protein